MNDIIATPLELQEFIRNAAIFWLFLDYDGTLAEFAPTPDDVYPDQELIDLITQITQQPALKSAIISGRRLEHIQTLIPVKGIWLAGTYGIELQSPEGELIHRLPYEQIRPILETIKPVWENIIGQQDGFYLEDKGWSLAIHAKDAPKLEAQKLLSNARARAANVTEQSPFRLLGGDRFLEIAPKKANKANTVEYLLAENNDHDIYSIYIGDDDKDEEAFQAIKEHAGTAILVSMEARKTLADFRLRNPQSVRQWLGELLIHLNETRI
jgi:trehalose-phosphatase